MNLRNVRQRAGLSQTELAARAGTTATYISWAENGRYVLSPGQAGRVANALGVQPQEVDELKSATSLESTNRAEAATNLPRAAR